MKKFLFKFLLTSFVCWSVVSVLTRTAIGAQPCNGRTGCVDLSGEVRCYLTTCQNACPECQGNGTTGLDYTWRQKIHNPFLSVDLSSLTGVGFLQKFLNLAITLCLVVGGVIFFFMLLSGGIRWIASSGDKTQLEEARKQITHALIGMVLLLSTFAIIQLIQSLFGVSLLNISLPTL